MELRLSPRLRAIAGMVPRCGCLADIGTDHGYIPAALLLEGRIETAIATDIREGPLHSAMRTAGELDLEGRIDFRLGDGLQALAPKEVGCAVIAGMGGEVIISILAAAPWAKEGLFLLLQPMSRAELLRRWLPENGYTVHNERLVEDRGRLYPILAVSGGSMPPASDAQAWGGFLLDGDPLWGRYLAERIRRMEKAAGGLALARDPGLAREKNEFLRVIAELTIRKGEWEDAHSS